MNRALRTLCLVVSAISATAQDSIRTGDHAIVRLPV